MQKLNVNDINLVNYFFPRVEVVANSSHEPKEATMTIFSINTHIEQLEDNHSYAVNIDVQADMDQSTNPPYSFHLSGVAFLNVSSEEYDGDNAKEACYQIGHQVLFGALREQLSTITSRGPWNAVHLRVVPAPQFISNSNEAIGDTTVLKEEMLL